MHRASAVRLNQSLQRTPRRAQRRGVMWPVGCLKGVMIIDFLQNNTQWIFSGIGVALIGWLLRYGYARWSETRTPTAPASRSTGLKVQRQTVGPKTLTSRLPSLLLRAILSPKSVASKVRISLRGEKPFNIALSTEVPHIEIYFEFTNLSPIDLILDRMLVDVWFCQPTFEQTILRRYFIPSGEITKGIFLRQHLTPAQATQIQKCVESSGAGSVIRLYITAYFESKAGRLDVEDMIDRSST